MQKVKWYLVLYGYFNRAPSPEMLEDGGLWEEKLCHIQGDSRFDPKQPRAVNYDRDFVIKWLVNKLLKKLEPANYNELQKLISEAWRVWKDEEKADREKSREGFLD
ncbi:hypothetical protein [Sphaerothrix gracilis]|uniref:hypothetical protein n=1 Tax=Sphaerothrix gracilis TaxID=3151835 RepID=UPI0031FCED7A